MYLVTGLVETPLCTSQPAPTSTVSTNPTMGHHIYRGRRAYCRS